MTGTDIFDDELPISSGFDEAREQDIDPGSGDSS